MPSKLPDPSTNPLDAADRDAADVRALAESEDLSQMTTEQPNAASAAIDELSALEIARLINREDASVAQAVGQEAEHIACAMQWIADAFRGGGRLVYLGAGTSGRLGVLDASECPPTFSTPPEMVIGIIAGGNAALTRAVEGAEDHPQQAIEDLRSAGYSKRDVLVGIATSGRTPYVVAGIRWAREQGGRTVGLSCNRQSQLSEAAELMITPVVGPEVVSGSTRLKAGTATKLVLNTLTTGAMILLGKTYGNLMVDLRATNNKLILRTRRILMQLTDVDQQRATEILDNCDGELKTAVVAQQLGVTPQQARQRLQDAGGHLRRALL